MFFSVVWISSSPIKGLTYNLSIKTLIIFGKSIFILLSILSLILFDKYFMARFIVLEVKIESPSKSSLFSKLFFFENICILANFPPNWFAASSFKFAPEFIIPP